jgi:hypothetical protein
MRFSLLVQCLLLLWYPAAVNHLLRAQPSEYKQDWQYPLPKEYSYLTGNMGELRNNHFHGGLDIRAPIGTPVYASADGYVCRVKVSSSGYGQVVYLLHPQSRHMSVYAHLSAFAPKIKAYVREAQYAQKSFFVELFPLPDALPVKKGEIIGYVGNTGFSFGPHLHYEIRNANDNLLDPQRFFPWLMPDRQPPYVQAIAIMPLRAHSRVQQGIERRVFSLVHKGNGRYELPYAVGAYGDIGLEVNAWDYMTAAQNRYAVRSLHVEVNGKRFFAWRIEDFPMDENFSINRHINYEVYLKSRAFFQRAYLTPDNRLGIYEGDGILHIEAGKSYRVRMVLTDVAGNESTVELQLYGQKPEAAIPKQLPVVAQPHIEWHIEKHGRLRMEVSGIGMPPQFLFLYRNGLPFKVPLAAIQYPKAVYLWDIGDAVPDWVEVNQERFYFPFYQLPAEKADTLRFPKLQLYVYPHSCYAPLFVKVAETAPGQLQIGEAHQLLARPIKIAYALGRPLKAGECLYYVSQGGGFSKVKEVQQRGDTLYFEAARLGEYRLIEDRQAPSVVLVRRSARQLFFRIADDFSGIERFEAYLNGRFLLMEYESKNHSLWSDPERQEPLRGSFELHVWDGAGNRQLVRLNL